MPLCMCCVKTFQLQLHVGNIDKELNTLNPAFCLSIASGPPQPNVLQIRSMIADAAYTYMISPIDSLLTADVINASFLGSLLSFCDTLYRRLTLILIIYMVR